MHTRRLTALERGVLGFDPNAGLVHLVQPGVGLLADDEHIIKDLYEDSNKGQRDVLNAQKGPFRKERGRSRIMSRSAHVHIRKRRKQIEITIRRAVTAAEIHALHAKLGAHSHTSPDSVVYLVEGGYRKKLGTFHDIDLLKLMELIRNILSSKKGTIGLLIIDGHTHGALHNTNIYSSRFNRRTYKGRTFHHKGVEPM